MPPPFLALDVVWQEIPRASVKRCEQVEQVTDRVGGRFAVGVSGNPAGRPPRRSAPNALQDALGALLGTMRDSQVASIGRVTAGLSPLVPASAVHAGETGWKRLLRLVPDSELDAIEALPDAEREALAVALGGVEDVADGGDA